MKKNIKLTLFLSILLVTLFSCDNDATSGILNNIVNSTEETEYEINAVAAIDNTNLYSLESDGIYLSVDNTTDDDSSNTRTLILDTADYLNIENLYYDGTNIYFISLDKDDNTTKVLYYFNPSVATPTPTSINNDGELLTIYSNGYVSAEINNKYYFQKISGTTAITAINANDSTITKDDSLAITVPLGDDLIIQTVNYDEDDADDSTFDYYFLEDATGNVTNFASDQDNKIVAAINDGSDYFAVLANADLIHIDDPTNTSANNITTYYDNDDSYEFDNLAPYMHFTDGSYNFLLLAEDSNSVMLYDLTDGNSDTDSGLTVLSEGFANIITNTSAIVYYQEVSNTGNEYIFYVATNTNGYYTMIVENASILDDDDSDNSNYSNEINADLTMDD